MTGDWGVIASAISTVLVALIALLRVEVREKLREVHEQTHATHVLVNDQLTAEKIKALLVTRAFRVALIRLTNGDPDADERELIATLGEQAANMEAEIRRRDRAAEKL